MKFLHTSDWHIGQQFSGYDRAYEHRQFFEWLTDTLVAEQIDVLLVSGDVFDVSNPSAESTKMFYAFLMNTVKLCPKLQIIITAGNHDSGYRLETPQPLVEMMNIHIVGVVKKDKTGAVDFSKLAIPIKDKSGETKVWCLAIPFLRMGDYSNLPESENPYSEGVAAFYQQAFSYIDKKRESHQAVVAMGHLHTLGAEIHDLKNAEREIMGGIEGITSSTFHDDICYVALGHIHKAQCINGKEHIRYSGSPLPMSFSEINYKHQVTLFEIDDEKIENLRYMEVPVSVPLMRVSGEMPEVIEKLEKLPGIDGKAANALYLEVRVFLEGPEPALRHNIEIALEGKNVRLAKIDARLKNEKTDNNLLSRINSDHLQEVSPAELLQNFYQNKYDRPLPENLLKLFYQTQQAVTQSIELQ